MTCDDVWCHVMSCDVMWWGEVVPLASALKSRNNYCQECLIPARYPLPPWSKQISTCNIRRQTRCLNNDGNTPGYSDHVYARTLPALPRDQTGIPSVGMTTMLATFSQPIADESGDRASNHGLNGRLVAQLHPRENVCLVWQRMCIHTQADRTAGRQWSWLHSPRKWRTKRKFWASRWWVKLCRCMSCCSMYFQRNTTPKLLHKLSVYIYIDIFAILRLWTVQCEPQTSKHWESRHTFRKPSSLAVGIDRYSTQC